MPARQHSRCKVLGCINQKKPPPSGTGLFLVPSSASRVVFEKWIELTGNEELCEVPIDHLRRNLRLCELHFRPDQVSPPTSKIKRLLTRGISTVVPTRFADDHVPIPCERIQQWKQSEHYNKVVWDSASDAKCNQCKEPHVTKVQVGAGGISSGTKLHQVPVQPASAEDTLLIPRNLGGQLAFKLVVSPTESKPLTLAHSVDCGEPGGSSSTQCLSSLLGSSELPVSEPVSTPSSHAAADFLPSSTATDDTEVVASSTPEDSPGIVRKMPNRGPSFTNRCWVQGCRHNKLEDKLNLTTTFFRFPTGNVVRCRAWLKVLGLESFLTLGPKQLNNKFVCEEHFRDYELRRYKLKTTLVTSAIPSNVPPGVRPLSDELVERWPPQKENQSAEEEVNLSLQKKIQSHRAPLANHVEDKSNADGMESDFSSSDILAKRVEDEHNYSSSIHLDSRASNSIPVVAPGAEQGFNSWAPSSLVCQIGNRLFAITGHSIETPEKYNASGRELDFSPSDSLAKHVEDEHNSSSIHLDSSASNSIPVVVPGAEQGFNCWTPSSLVCEIGLLDCLL